MALFRQHRPDITLMDLRLPGANGTDTLIAIRGEFPQARIIMLTTSDSGGEIERTLRAGASGYIVKSVPQDDMLTPSDQFMPANRTLHDCLRHGLHPVHLCAALSGNLPVYWQSFAVTPSSVLFRP